VLNATSDLLVERGYAGTTIEEIAARSGVAKTTIYRRWPNRPALLVELLLKVAAKAAPPPRVGDDPLPALRRELHRVAAAAEGLGGRILIALLGEAEHDPQLREALVQGLFTPRRKATAAVVEDGQRTGILRRGIPPLVATDLIFGPFFYRRFIRQEAVTRSFLDQTFAFAMKGLAAEPPARRRGAARPSGDRAVSRATATVRRLDR
jgi:AcrR family transcriptional regulator